MTEHEEKEQLSLFTLLCEGLNQIESRHEAVIKSLHSLPKSVEVEHVLSELHFTRLQARGLHDKTKAHFVEYAHLYNE